MLGELQKTNTKQPQPHTVCVTRKDQYFVVSSLERQYLIPRNSADVKQTRDDDFVIFHDQQQNLRLKVSIDVGIPIESVGLRQDVEFAFNPQAIESYFQQE